MTSNPTIFETAIAETTLYDEDIQELVAKGASPAAIFELLAVVVTDGVSEALEGRPETPPLDVIAQAIAVLPSSDPDRACEAVLRLARAGLGPPGVPGWEDDRTAVAFGLARPRGAKK